MSLPMMPTAPSNPHRWIIPAPASIDVRSCFGWWLLFVFILSPTCHGRISATTLFKVRRRPFLFYKVEKSIALLNKRQDHYNNETKKEKKVRHNNPTSLNPFTTWSNSELRCAYVFFQLCHFQRHHYIWQRRRIFRTFEKKSDFSRNTAESKTLSMTWHYMKGIISSSRPYPRNIHIGDVWSIQCDSHARTRLHAYALAMFSHYWCYSIWNGKTAKRFFFSMSLFPFTIFHYVFVSLQMQCMAYDKNNNNLITFKMDFISEVILLHHSFISFS